jgi:predicted nucleotidyltransferase
MKDFSKEEAIEIAKRFISEKLSLEVWYKNIEKDIKAILLYGSRAKRTNRIGSDIDILIILPLELEKKFTKGEYVIYFESFEINIVLRSIEKLRTIDFKKDAFQKEVFRKSEFILENDNEVRRLLK